MKNQSKNKPEENQNLKKTWQEPELKTLSVDGGTTLSPRETSLGRS